MAFRISSALRVFVLLGAVLLSACTSEMRRDLGLEHQEPEVQTLTASAATTIDPETLVIREPRIGELHLSKCLRRARQCGAPAANAYCRSKGYEHAQSFELSYPGQRGPTVSLADGRQCTGLCGSFNEITCKNRLERTFVNPQLRGAPLDSCRRFGAECGLPAAKAFCRTQGFSNAVEFGVYEPGVRARTEVLVGSRRSCEGETCGAFRFIRCSRV